MVDDGMHRGMVTPGGGRSPLITLTQLFSGLFFTNTDVELSTTVESTGSSVPPPPPHAAATTRRITVPSPTPVPFIVRVLRSMATSWMFDIQRMLSQSQSMTLAQCDC